VGFYARGRRPANRLAVSLAPSRQTLLFSEQGRRQALPDQIPPFLIVAFDLCLYHTLAAYVIRAAIQHPVTTITPIGWLTDCVIHAR